MIANTRPSTEPDKQIAYLNKFFRKDFKIKYSRKLSAKVRLYVSEKNALKSITNILSLYQQNLN